MELEANRPAPIIVLVPSIVNGASGPHVLGRRSGRLLLRRRDVPPDRKGDGADDQDWDHDEEEPRAAEDLH